MMNDVGRINAPVTRPLTAHSAPDRAGVKALKSVTPVSQPLSSAVAPPPSKIDNTDKRLKEARDEAKSRASSDEATSELVAAVGKGPLDIVADIVAQYIPDASPNTRLSILEDSDTGQYVYRSIDRESGDVVRQFPSEEILKYLHRSRSSVGLLLDNDV